MVDEIRKLIAMDVSMDYVTGKDTINDVINNINEAVISIDKKDNTYYDLSCNYLARIDLISDVLSMKKLKDNREDALVLINLLKENVNGLEKVIKEVEVDVTTSE